MRAARPAAMRTTTAFFVGAVVFVFDSAVKPKGIAIETVHFLGDQFWARRPVMSPPTPSQMLAPASTPIPTTTHTPYARRKTVVLNLWGEN